MSPPTSERRNQTVAGGASVLVLGRYAVAGLGWAGTIFIIRRLSPEDWGGFSLIFSLLGIVGVVSELRVSRIVVQELVTHGDDAGAVMRPFITLRMLLGLLSYAVAMAVVCLGHFPPKVVLGTAVAGTVLVFASMGTAIDLFLNSRMWMRPVAVASVVGQLSQFVATLALFTGNARSIVLFALPAVVFEVVALAWRFQVVRGMFPVRPAVDLRRWWAWLRESAPLALGVGLTIIYLQIDLIMVARIGSLTEAGNYAIGYKFAGLIRYVPDAVSTAVLSTLVRAWPEDPQGFRRAFQQGATLLIFAAGGVAAEFALFTEPMIRLLYGERYSPAALATQGLVLGELIAFFSALCFVTLVSVRRNIAYPVAALVGVVVNVGLNLVFIPRWSYNGAALATVITQASVLLIMGWAASRVPGVGGLPLDAMAKAAVAVAVAVALGAAVGRWVPWPLAGLLVAATYLGALRVLRFNGRAGLRAIFGRS